MKATAGLSSTSMWKGGKEIGENISAIKDHKETITDSTQKVKILIPIMHPYFAAIGTSRKYN